MISEERLKELCYIPNTIIYCVKENKIVKIALGYDEIETTLEDLFETKEEAEWELEFGNITRTETLKLLTWEEFITKDKTITLYKNQVKYQMYIFVKNKNTNNCRIIIYADDNSQDWLVFEKPLTKENYIEACRLCKQLFLGEKV